MIMKPWQENTLFAIFIGAFLFIGFSILSGCRQEPYLNKQYALKGHCFVWDWVEKKAKGKEKCYIPWPQDSAIECTREDGHKKRHHAHYGGHCIAVWY